MSLKSYIRKHHLGLCSLEKQEEEKKNNFEKHIIIIIIKVVSIGVMLLKYKLTFIFIILLSTSFLSTICTAGRPSKLLHEAANGGVLHEDAKRNEIEDIHERVLRVNTKDYGRYDPAPVFVKPPFKLIPN